MTATIEAPYDHAPALVSLSVSVRDAVWPAVQQLLASPVFARAPRMCHLLSFLVDKKLSGREDDITEYAIGLDVFRRDVLLYDTTLDPVVRVQVGRLPGRLAAYYAALGTTPPVHIALPLGSYIPVISQMGSMAPAMPPEVTQLLQARLTGTLEGRRSHPGSGAGSRLLAQT